MTSGGTTWTNTYNSDGLRTSRTDGTTTYTYIYENGRLSAIKRNDLNMWIIYDDNGPVTLKYGSGTFHYVTNPQGDVVAIVGNQGQKLVEYTYDAWGKVTSITGDYAYNLGIHNPILYRGYVYDHETGLYYCQSRYYDPETGRFLNADAFASTGQGFIGNNMFAYCGNNPVNYCDPAGTSVLDVLKSDVCAIHFDRDTISTIAGAAVGLSIGVALDDLWDTISASFARAIRRSYQTSHEKHHLVAKKARNAELAAEILNSTLPGGVENPLNLISIKTGLHRRLHTKNYYYIANALVIEAYNSSDNKEEQQQNVVMALTVLRVIVFALDVYAPF